jgi:hypothetical protein
MLPDLMRTPRLVKWLCIYLLGQWSGRGNGARFGVDPQIGYAFSILLGQWPGRGNAARFAAPPRLVKVGLVSWEGEC